MKIALIFVLVCLIAAAVSGNEENGLNDEELQELISGYKGFGNNNGMSEPVRFLS